MQIAYCVKENKPCNEWVEKYFQDCLCNIKDDISFAFGLVSLVCWGVAEIPQIITNFRSKSSHGVSLAFLLTWVAGDAFNLVGCLLEPATLPTQFYTALLYTVSTVVLVIQTLYYDHLRKLWKRKKSTASQKNEEDEHKKPLRCKSDVNSSIPIPNPSPKGTTRREFYFTSARSLASSGTPPFRTYLRTAKSGPPAMVIQSDDSSSDDEHQHDSALPVRSTTLHATQPRRIPQQASYGTFLASSVNLFRKSEALTQAYIGFTGRKLLNQENVTESHTVYGQWLGWMMAAIYMGGRLPQIWLNIKRGSVEGLNPLMFIFALVANVTYVGSILVRSTEWEKIKANMPWLLDAIVCVALDLFIILQYIYYRYYYMDRQSRRNIGEDSGDYAEQHKQLVSYNDALRTGQ